MSYKFQRLREKIRRAVERGELSGKLPGERALARRFRVNAKTLSKALTDLAAEGVLDRSIGRGTYVKGSAPATFARTGRWLCLCAPGDEDACPVLHLRAEFPDIEIANAVESMRPSFLTQFNGVMNLCASTPDDFLRSLLVRNMSVVALNHEPKTYSMHAVLPDVMLGASRLARDLLLSGHRRLAALEPRGSKVVARALRQTCARFAPHAEIDDAEPAQASVLVDRGVTGLVCASATDARQARAALAASDADVPRRVSLVATGCACGASCCSGYFVECRQIVDAAVGLLRGNHTRPVVLWLAGSWVDRGTLAPAAGLPLENPVHLRISGGIG